MSEANAKAKMASERRRSNAKVMKERGGKLEGRSVSTFISTLTDSHVGWLVAFIAAGESEDESESESESEDEDKGEWPSP